MVNFNDFDLEIQDTKDSTAEQFSGTIPTAGTPITITPSSGKVIQLVLIQNPSKGPNGNSSQNVVLLLNVDGTAHKFTIPRGSGLYVPGIFSSFTVDTNVSGTKYEIVVWS